MAYMENEQFSLQDPDWIIETTGGNLQRMQQGAQTGQFNPTSATLAAMKVKRIRGAAALEGAPQQTVAEQALSTQPQQMAQNVPPPGLGAGPPGMPQTPAVPNMPTQRLPQVPAQRTPMPAQPMASPNSAPGFAEGGGVKSKGSLFNKLPLGLLGGIAGISLGDAINAHPTLNALGIGVPEEEEEELWREGERPKSMMAAGGLASLPIPDEMFDDRYADGGIVAFASGKIPGSADVERILATLRHNESRNNYQAINSSPKSTASGAYQFTDDTWLAMASRLGINTTQYPTASSAPPDVQDAVAEAHVSEILAANDGDVSAVPKVWFTGNPEGNMTPTQIAANPGVTSESYVNEFLDAYGGDTQIATSGRAPAPLLPLGQRSNLKPEGMSPDATMPEGYDVDALLSRMGYTPETYAALSEVEKNRLLETMNIERGLTRAVTSGAAGALTTQPYAALADLGVALPANVTGEIAGALGRTTGILDPAAPNPWGFTNEEGGANWTPYYDELVRKPTEANQPLTREYLDPPPTPPGLGFRANVPEDQAALAATQAQYMDPAPWMTSPITPPEEIQTAAQGLPGEEERIAARLAAYGAPPEGPEALDLTKMREEDRYDYIARLGFGTAAHGAESGATLLGSIGKAGQDTADSRTDARNILRKAERDEQLGNYDRDYKDFERRVGAVDAEYDLTGTERIARSSRAPTTIETQIAALGKRYNPEEIAGIIRDAVAGGPDALYAAYQAATELLILDRENPNANAMVQYTLAELNRRTDAASPSKGWGESRVRN